MEHPVKPDITTVKEVHSGHGTCCLSTTKERLANLRSGAMSDLTIVFPDTDKTIQAHTLVLAMSSPVFEAMFNSLLAVKGVLTLPKEDDPMAFEWVLNYLYKDDTDLPSHLTLSVYRIAHKYCLCPLVRFCSKRLQCVVSFSNFPHIYNQAVLYEDSDLLDRCHQLVDKMTDRVLVSPEVINLTHPALSSLLSHHTFSPSSELGVFLAILTWGRANLTSSSTGDQSPSWPKRSLRRAVEKFLPLVHFLTMTTDEFVKHVLPSGVFSHSEGVAILLKIKDIPGACLPEAAPSEVTKSRARKNPGIEEKDKEPKHFKRTRRNSDNYNYKFRKVHDGKTAR